MKYLIILALIVMAWSPWLKAEEAMQLVNAKVIKLQEQKPNLCAMFIHENTIRRVPFGYTEQVSYDCTVTDTVYGVEQSRNIVFVTFYKGVIGMPSKTATPAAY